ncbi:SpoVR family protein [Vibrio sp. PP-XX7]
MTAIKEKSASKQKEQTLDYLTARIGHLISLEQYHQEVKRVAEHYRLDTYQNQIEVITSEQMMDAYSSIGMPINYNHWSFGKKFIQTEQGYKHGQMGLASKS